MPRPLARLDAAQPLPMRPAIRIRDLRKTFAQLIAIDGVSLDIAHGEFFMIVGPSGCGKTTLLRILAGLDSVTSGTIETETPNSQRPVNSMIFQGDSIFPWMTVWDNAAYGLKMRRAPTATIKDVVGRYLARVCQRSRNSADGRAVLGARRAEQAPVAGGVAAHLGGAQEDRGVHHPFRRRGGISGRSHHGHDGAAGDGEGVRASAARAAARHHGTAEDAAIRRADCAHLVELARGGAPCAPAGGGDEIMSVQTISTRSPAAPKLSARTRDRLLNVISPLALLVLWELCARFGFIDTRFFPAPSSVVSTMIEMLRTGELVTHTAVSMQRLLYGAILGGVPALVLGIAMGLNRPIRALFDPLIAATYPVPKSAILPLALLIFGLGEASKIFMVAVGVFFPVVINATTGVLEINKIYLDVGQNYKANRWNTFWTIALPGALPVIMTGFKLGIGIGLVLIAVAEMVGAKSGLGYLIWSAWSTFAVEQMYVGLFVIAIIGFLITLTLNELERVIIPWKAE